MSYITFHTDDEGILAATQALNDARALLRRRKKGSASDDRDYALQFQLESLENTLGEITDARFARTLSEGEDGVAVVGNENVGTLMLVVATAQEMLADYNSLVFVGIGLPAEPLHGAPDYSSTSRSNRGATSSGHATTQSGATGGAGISLIAGPSTASRNDFNELISWAAGLNSNTLTPSPSTPTSHSFWDWTEDEDLEPPADPDDEPPPRSKGKQRASSHDDIADETDTIQRLLELVGFLDSPVLKATSSGALFPKQEETPDEEDEIILFHRASSASTSPPSPSTSFTEGLHRSIPGRHTTSPGPERLQSQPPGQASLHHSTFNPFFKWSSDKGSTPLDYESEKPLPNLPGSPIDSLLELSSEDQGSERLSVVSSRNSSSRSLHSDPCVVCGDPSDILESMAAPCGHWYCRSCVGDLITAYMNDESLHPLRCCKTEIPICVIEILLCDTGDLIRFRDKHEEYSTPHDKRTYCPQRGCQRFIKPSRAPTGATALGRWLSRAPDTARCVACNVSVCLLCKELAHPGEKCEENKNTARLHELAREKEWQTCSKCHSIVEKIDGCLHMICRCGYEFCYRCGAEYTGPGMCGH